MIFPLEATLLAMIVLTSLPADASLSVDSSIAATRQDATKLHMRYCNNSQNAPMWGDVDPNIFYICDEVSNATRQLHCPLGHGFFNGHGYYGCMPFAKWPACIDSISRSSNDSPGSQLPMPCNDEENLQQTWAAVDPNEFFMCQEKNAAPLLLNCEPGKGYVSTWVSGVAGGKENIHIVGCAPWQDWRLYMHCDGFY